MISPHPASIHPALVYAPPSPTRVGGATAEVAQGFGDMLAQGIEKANLEHTQADDQITHMVKTQGENVHEAMVALSRAEITLRLTQRVGQKLVSAYQDLSRMQI